MAIDPVKKEALKKLIAKEVFITGDKERISMSDDPAKWIFDFRRIIMNGQAADLISEIFWEEFSKDYPFQVCTLEIGGVPLATSIMNKIYQKGHHDSNAFFIRKSRKKTGLHRMIEGKIQSEKRIILVDDVVNSGNSFWRQIEVLDALEYKVDTVWTILRYRDAEFYKRFHLRGIEVKSIFTLDDFSDLHPNVKNLEKKEVFPPVMPFSVEWVFQSSNPSLGLVCGKSQPVIDDSKIYFGSDEKYFWALNQTDGTVAWKFSVGPVAKKKAIFSNPVLHKDTVIFGSYDGNVYCLDKNDGSVRWINFDADWVGSSPALAKDLNLIFIGLEFGLLRKHGGLIALDADTGKSIWIDRSHIALTHCSPMYIEGYQQVVAGSNDGIARLHDAKTGEHLWSFTTFGAADYDPSTWTGRIGYSAGDIKEGFVYSQEHDYIIFGAVDGFLYVLERATGHLVKYVKCKFGIFSTPYIYEDKVYFTATDKTLRCLDLKTLELTFEVALDNTRIFSSPTVINKRLYVGTNAGKLHELNYQTGEREGYFQARERITNTVVYNKETDTYFLPTYANEIICLKRFEA